MSRKTERFKYGIKIVYCNSRGQVFFYNDEETRDKYFNEIKSKDWKGTIILQGTRIDLSRVVLCEPIQIQEN